MDDTGIDVQVLSLTAPGLQSQEPRQAMSLQAWVNDLIAERIMFSSDYPYRFTPGGGARRFFENVALSDADRMAIAHGNWERMVADIRRPDDAPGRSRTSLDAHDRMAFQPRLGEAQHITIDPKTVLSQMQQLLPATLPLGVDTPNHLSHPLIEQRECRCEMASA